MLNPSLTTLCNTSSYRSARAIHPVSSGTVKPSYHLPPASLRHSKALLALNWLSREKAGRSLRLISGPSKPQRWGRLSPFSISQTSQVQTDETRRESKWELRESRPPKVRQSRLLARASIQGQDFQPAMSRYR